MTAITEQLTSVKTGKPHMFESQVCGRCGGSGHYSYCQSHGTRCFGCGGHGIKLTKRGAAAQEHFTALLSKRADELEPGDKIRVEASPFSAGGWATVTEVIVKDDGTADVRTDRVSYGGFDADKVYRVAASAERKAEAKAEALVYQATLTKAGKPRK